MFLTKQQISERAGRRQRPEPSEVLGGDLCIRELLRSEYRALQVTARETDNLDLWNVSIFCAVVVDPNTGRPLFTPAEVLDWAERADLWAEVLRIANAGLNFSEVGPDALTKSGDGVDAE